MKVFIGVSFNRDHETVVVGASDSRDGALRLVELARSEMLTFSGHAIDEPDGNVALDDSRGDMVGHVLSFDVAGAAALNWEWHSDSDSLIAASTVWHDDESPLEYAIDKLDASNWRAMFEGSVLHAGTLEDCMASCRKCDDEAILAAIQN